jgi:hypothetical protein
MPTDGNLTFFWLFITFRNNIFNNPQEIFSFCPKKTLKQLLDVSITLLEVLMRKFVTGFINRLVYSSDTAKTLIQEINYGFSN